MDLKGNIPKLPGYYISRDGVLINLKTGNTIKWHFHHQYYRARIRHKNVKLHRLLAEVYIPNPHNYPLVRHLNSNRKDNRIENLAWGTSKDNREDDIRNGIHDIRGRNNPGWNKYGSKNYNAKLSSEDRIVIKFLATQGFSKKEIWSLFSDRVCEATISRVINSKYL